MTYTDNAGSAFGPAPSVSEEWRPIPGYGWRYEVSNLGRVRSWVQTGRWGKRLTSPKELSGRPDRKGYLQVNLALPDRGGKNHPIHRLVGDAFLGPPPQGLVTCHTNGIKTDNRAENLRYDTYAGNEADKLAHGTHQRGERSGNAKLTEAQVVEIFHDLRPQRSIARDYGVRQQYVSRIKRGTAWAHLGLATKGEADFHPLAGQAEKPGGRKAAPNALVSAPQRRSVH